jgi:single-strand DNA-binding protein
VFQNTVVVGHLGGDPEMKYTQTGQPVTNFSLATSRKWKDDAGESHEKTTWFRVAAWGKLAELCNQYLTKGRLVLVEGEIEASAWTDKEGKPRASLELRAQNVRFLGAKPAGESTESAEVAADTSDVPF